MKARCAALGALCAVLLSPCACQKTVIPGTGYGCHLPCNTADVNYVLTARVETYRIRGSARLGVSNFQGASSPDDIWGGDTPLANRSDWSYRTRTFVDGGSTSEFCLGMGGYGGPMGPCLQVAPGQSMMVRVVNRMGDGMRDLRETVPTSEGWYEVEEDQRNRTTGQYLRAHGNQLYGTLPTNSNARQGLDSNLENLPGHDTGTDAGGHTYGFDSTNLHLHGLEVEPHLFYPQGTSEPDADWITIEPDDHAGRHCHCYHFHVSEENAVGTFLYHIHRHGSTAMQGWSGMFGVLAVVAPDASVAPVLAERNLDAELERLGVGEAPFVMWDPHLKVLSGGNGTDPGNVVLATDSFLNAQTSVDIIPFLVNDAFQPFVGQEQADPQPLPLQGAHGQQLYSYLRPNEPLRLRIACVTTENLCGFKLRENFANGTADPNGQMQTFYHVASDGFAFDRAYPKQFFVLAGGMREDVILLLPRPGLYAVWQQALVDKQWLGTGPADQLLAYVLVAGSKYSRGKVTAEYLMMPGRFTPGRPKSDDIRPQEIHTTREITFSMETQLGEIPYSQFKVNMKAFDHKRTDQVIGVSGRERVEEWVISNNQNMNHPFHIHVNPFQVKEVRSNACLNTYNRSDCASMLSSEFYRGVTVQQFEPRNRWRDTVIVPPYGFVRIWQRFTAGAEKGSAFVGKSVFHCHFLAHEDTGMIANMLLTDNVTQVEAGLDRSGYRLRGHA